MSYSIDLATHGRELKQAYDAIVSSDPSVKWAVFNYAGQSNALSLRSKGSEELDEFIEEFDDGKVQYGFARVDYHNLPKFVLIGWVGEGVPERTKGYFNAHFSTVAKYFHGYHVQITARSSSDLSEQIIMQKVETSSGSKYNSGSVPLRPKYKPQSLNVDQDWGDAEPVTETELSKVESSYKPTKVDVHASRTSSSDRPEPVKSSYEPVGKVDIAAIRAQAKGNKFANDKPTPASTSYQPIGKVDIAAIRAQAKQANYKESIESTPVKTELDQPQNGEEQPKSVKDRMTTFSSSRMTEMPKPKVQNSVASRFTPAAKGHHGTAPALPSDGIPKSSSAAPGFKNFGAEGGKTPAQLWAEKHAKTSPASPPVNREPSPEPQQQQQQQQHQQQQQDQEQDDDYEKPSISDLKNKFSHASIKEDEKPVSAAPASSAGGFSDFTSKFAKQASPTPPPAPPRESSPVRMANPVAAPEESESDPEPEIEPARAVPPPPPAPVAAAAEERAVPPPPPPAGVAAAQSAVAAAISGGAAPAAPAAPEPETSQGAQGASAIAEYDYEVAEEGEIGFDEGEKIVDIEFVDPDWWQGTNSKGETGLFPSNYVELIEDDVSVPAAAPAPVPVPVPAPAPVATSVAEPTSPAPQAAAQDQGATATAEFDYEVAEEGEIGFGAGEQITHIEFIDPDWWQGTNAAGQTGLFPGNHVVLNE